MRKATILAAWGTAAGLILFAALRPGSGVLWHNPAAMLAIGAVGLGLIQHARQTLAASLIAEQSPATTSAEE